MKILIINTYYYPNMIGGTEHSIKILSESLMNQGNEVAVLTADAEQHYEESLINGIKIYRIGIMNHDKNGRYFLTQKFSHISFKINELDNHFIKKYLNKVLIDFNPDVVHTNNLFGLSTYVWKYFSNKNVPIVHTLRDYWLLDPRTELNKTNPFITFFYQKYNKRKTKYVNYVTAPSQFTLNTFINKKYFYNADSSVVVNCLKFDYDKIKKYISDRIKNNNDFIYFLFVGMLSEHKGIIKLLDVFSKLDRNNLILNICGQGPLKKTVEEYSLKYENINYLGQLSTEELEKVYLNNDVLIVPSIWDEPFGRIVIEGNSYGLPVIASNKGGLVEIIRSMNSGITYNYNSMDELKKCILLFADRNYIKSYYPSIINNIEKYSNKKQADSFLLIYKALASNQDKEVKR